MSISSIGASVIASVQKLSSGTGSLAPTAASAAQEAAESQVTTAKEAQNGDPVAKKKLLQLQAKQQEQAATEKKASEPGKGESLDHEG